jgi:7-cyano-7-deazaguanine synthase
VVLLSGGLDSAANLAFCRRHDEPVLALTADYGQRAALREIDAARLLCSHFDVRHEVVRLPWLGQLGGSSLTETSRAVPVLGADQLDVREATESAARSVWVPNRNGVLIAMAAAFAERLGADRVVVGFNLEEAVTFPDNSGEFLHAATAALAFSTATKVEAYCYTTEWDKRRIVDELRRSIPDFPFSALWSCYHGADRPCGSCESCRRFERAGV